MADRKDQQVDAKRVFALTEQYLELMQKAVEPLLEASHEDRDPAVLENFLAITIAAGRIAAKACAATLPLSTAGIADYAAMGKEKMLELVEAAATDIEAGIITLVKEKQASWYTARHLELIQKIATLAGIDETDTDEQA